MRVKNIINVHRYRRNRLKQENDLLGLMIDNMNSKMEISSEKLLSLTHSNALAVESMLSSLSEKG